MLGEMIEEELLEMADDKLKAFQNKLSIGKDELQNIGIRVPKLREYSKKLCKDYDLETLLENINEDFYEEVMLKGLIITNQTNLGWEDIKKYVKYYLPKIVDWSLCDTFVCGLKIIKKHKDEMWDLIQELLQSDEDFTIRFCLVCLLNYYVDEDHIEDIYDIINSITNTAYYVKMANAWLISVCIIKFYDDTVEYLKNDCHINTWTYNKGIQKATESSRLSKEQKDEIRKLKK